MKTIAILLLCLMLITAEVHAEDILPEGCYKADGSADCFVPESGQPMYFLNPALYSDQLDTEYGTAMATFIQLWWDDEKKIKSLQRQIKKLKKGKNGPR